MMNITISNQLVKEQDMNATLSPLATFIDSLVDHFTLSYRVAQRNLDGIAHEESLIQPQPAGNSLHWVARHLVATRDKFLPALGASPVLSAPADSMRLDQLITAWGESQDRLITGLRNLTEERLAADAPFAPGGGKVTAFQPFLVRCAFHEAYHTGQLGILRRLLGKPGVM
jgi:uncharacterized damage-inducible protein DinB